MDRSWMYDDPLSPEYLNGVEDFCRRAIKHQEVTNDRNIYCPCRDCNNMRRHVDIDVIKDHLFRRGFKQDYTIWLWHGEKVLSRPNDYNRDGDGIGLDVDREESHNHNVRTDSDAESENDDIEDDRMEELNAMRDQANERPSNFESVYAAAETPLYPECTKYTKLSTVLTLFNLKAKGGWSDTSFTTLLEFLSDVLSEGNQIPTSTYYAKKLMCPLGLEYIKIDACPNDCVLFRNEYEKLNECPVCGKSRYKHNNMDSENKGSPAKVLWYLPIIPRLQRLFSIKKEANKLRWHADERKNDGLLRHPADSPQWRNIDKKYPIFGKEARNLRLALCTDGMNPYGTLSSQHSTWPVLLAVYNLPPWLCMKRKYIMLSLLISGPKQPGNDIDVYLAPLIDDLKMLWDEGVPTFDANLDSTFTMRAMIFCTINDFPAYGNLSGYKTKGAQACPICEDDMISFRLDHCSKHVYVHNRRLLSRHHPYRKMKKQFNGCIEKGESRGTLTGKQVYERIKNIETKYGKCFKEKSPKGVLWKKVSIFWDLPYWKDLSETPPPKEKSKSRLNEADSCGTNSKETRLRSKKEISSLPSVINHPLGPECKILQFLKSVKSDKFDLIPISLRAVVWNYKEDHQTYVYATDIDEFLRGACANISVVQVFMEYLFQEYKDLFEKSEVVFICPHRISLTEIKSDPQQAVHYVKDVFLAQHKKGSPPPKLIIVPSNMNNHWLLYVVGLYNGTCYTFDSANMIYYDEKEPVNAYGLLTLAYQIYRYHGATSYIKDPLKQLFNLKKIKCANQPGAVECAYYMMKYMIEIFELLKEGKSDLEKEYAPRTTPYTNMELDEVRESWAKFFRNKYLSS